MLSVKKSKSWETVSIRIDNKEVQLPQDTIKIRKILFLLTNMMESIYYRLWDLVTQSKYDKIKKSKMKTELKRITIGTVEKCILALCNLTEEQCIVEIGRFFTEKDNHFRTKIHNYANYSIEEDEMKPHFIDSSNEIAELEFHKLTRRYELNDFDFSRKPS